MCVCVCVSWCIAVCVECCLGDAGCDFVCVTFVCMRGSALQLCVRDGMCVQCVLLCI